MVDTTVFISIVIVAITQMIKMGVKQVSGWVTILVAFVVGILVAVFGGPLGVVHISIASGIISALGAIGISTAFSKAGGGTTGDITA